MTGAFIEKNFKDSRLDLNHLEMKEILRILNSFKIPIKECYLNDINNRKKNLIYGKITDIELFNKMASNVKFIFNDYNGKPLSINLSVREKKITISTENFNIKNEIRLKFNQNYLKY